MGSQHEYETKGKKVKIEKKRGMYQDVEGHDDVWEPDNYGHTTHTVHEGGYNEVVENKRGMVSKTHGTGAGYIIDPQGNMQNMAVNQSNYCKGGRCDTVDKNYEFKVGGIARINYDKDVSSEVGGNFSQSTKGSSSMVSKGPATIGSTNGPLVARGDGFSIGNNQAGSPPKGRITGTPGGSFHINGQDIDIQAEGKLTFHCKSFHVAAKEGVNFGDSGKFFVETMPVVATRYPKEKSEWQGVRSQEPGINSNKSSNA